MYLIALMLTETKTTMRCLSLVTKLDAYQFVSAFITKKVRFYSHGAVLYPRSRVVIIAVSDSVRKVAITFQPVGVCDQQKHVGVIKVYFKCLVWSIIVPH